MSDLYAGARVGDNLLPHCILASLQTVPWQHSAIKLNASISWQDDANILAF